MSKKIYQGKIKISCGFISLSEDEFDWLVQRIECTFKEGTEVELRYSLADKERNCLGADCAVFKGKIYAYTSYYDDEDYWRPFCFDEILTVGGEEVLDLDWKWGYEGKWMYMEIEGVNSQK